MRFTTSALLTVASLPILIAATGVNGQHQARHLQHARQAASSAPAPTTAAPAPTTSAAAPPPASTPDPASSAPAPTTDAGSAPATAPPVVPTSYSFSLLSTNPNAVPLAQITANATSQATVALDTTEVPAATPTWATNAPGLPNIALLVPSNYPALDKAPPTDSPEVQQWIQEVANSGITIPNITANAVGGCPANLANIQDDSERCWWTCTGCTRPTDITTCPDKLTWGLTYDDGPAPYTPTLLQFLDENDLKSTFFVVGSRVISYPAMLQAEYMGGHQIAVHTWSHPSLTTISNEDIIAELGWSKKVIKDVLGVTPNMMRPPYGDIDDRVRAISTAMGLTPVIWTRISVEATFDTNDFNIAGNLTTVGQVLENWEDILGNATQIDTGFIVLEHDLFQQSVDVATGYILPDAIAHKFTIQPVVTCLNKPLTDAYIELNNNVTNPPPNPSVPAVVLSSGAPGSAQATGKAASSASTIGISTLSVLGAVLGGIFATMS